MSTVTLTPFYITFDSNTEYLDKYITIYPHSREQAHTYARRQWGSCYSLSNTLPPLHRESGSVQLPEDYT